MSTGNDARIGGECGGTPSPQRKRRGWRGRHDQWEEDPPLPDLFWEGPDYDPIFFEILSNCVSLFPEFSEIDPVFFRNPQQLCQPFSGILRN
jgi:hypothetical protein